MRTSLVRLASCLVVALGSYTTNSAFAVPVPIPPAPPLQTALKQRDGRAIILQPTQIKPGQSIAVTHTQLGDGSVKKGHARGVQLVVYGTTKDSTTGLYPVLFSDTLTFERTGPSVNTFRSYTHPVDGQPQGIIAILIGLLLPANDPTSTRTALLPRGDAITAEIHDPGTGIALLLPAVQKVREAASR